MREARQDISGNLRAFYRHIGRGAGILYGERAGVEIVWNRGGGWPALMVGIPNREAVRDLAQGMHCGELPPLLIVDAEVPELIQALEAQGLRRFRTWRGMHLDPLNFRPAKAGDLLFRENGAGDLEDLRMLVNAALLGGLPMGTRITDAFLTSEAIDWMVGYHHGTAVTAGVLCVEGGIGGLYLLATEREYRGRGYGSALLSELVRLALRKGVVSLVLHSSAMGENLYRQAGFLEVETYTLLISLGS
jgi:GNAT superfamily N-acetyltransferase